MKSPLIAFSLTLLLSAAAMFSVQPMAGRMLLPLVGGTPSGWVVAMAFFQVMLLLGYLLAHLLSRLSPRGHGAAYIALLVAGLFFLPPNFADKAGLIGETPGAFDVFLLLSATIALPFIALSATSSTLQRLFMTTGHAAAKDPYFLYAASNLGSFAGLFAYPLLVDPFAGLEAQAQGWRVFYALVIFCVVLCLALSGKKKEKAEAPAKPPGWKQRAEWALLAFLPSSLLLGITAFITTDICSIPLVWVLPLGLYLLTFVMAFSRKPLIPMRDLEALVPYAAWLTVLLAVAFLYATFKILPLLLFSFFVVALYCHMRLAARRPEGGALTEFYLVLAAGGALGGVVNAFIIPHVLERAVEYPLTMLAAATLAPTVGFRTRAGKAILALVAAIFLLVLSGAALPQLPVNPASGRLALVFVLIMLALMQDRKLVLGATTAFIISEFFMQGAVNTSYSRNFFGVIRVYEDKREIGGGMMAVRHMQHGTTKHGTQLLGRGYSATPTLYFSRKGPAGEIFGALKPRKVAIIGLGAGALACHNAPDREFTFIEIDPAVVETAREKFTFLDECKSKAPPEIVIGDGRLELAKMEGKKFNLIIVDAFSSDVIPTHLLTQEAMKVYLDRLTADGVLALHVSNRYFWLHTPIAATAAALGLKSRYLARMDNLESYASKSIWVAVARKDADLRALAKWENIPHADTKPWTDDYSNLLGALYFE